MYIHAHNIYASLLFQTLSIPYKHIHFTLVQGIYTYFSLTCVVRIGGEWIFENPHETEQIIIN